MQALQEFAEATTHMFSVSCRFRCDAPILIQDIATADHLYRIAQEATSNAVRHGHANMIVITLEANDEGAVLRVADDGVGMSDPHKPNSGMGLRIMRERAKLIGVDLKIVSLPGKGTIVSCHLPIATEYHQVARSA
jgi:signal transduction histidine kinase